MNPDTAEVIPDEGNMVTTFLGFVDVKDQRYVDQDLEMASGVVRVTVDIWGLTDRQARRFRRAAQKPNLESATAVWVFSQLDLPIDYEGVGVPIPHGVLLTAEPSQEESDTLAERLNHEPLPDDVKEFQVVVKQ
jgi:hypothetical protein